MIKQQFSAALVCLLMLAFAMPPPAAAQTDDKTAKVKAQIIKRGTGEKKEVKLRTLDGKNLKGYINRADADSFVFTNTETGQVTTFAYRDVASVKKIGGLSTAAIVALAGVAAAAVIVAITFGTYCRNEGGC